MRASHTALGREQAGRRLRLVTINVRILTRLDLLGRRGQGHELHRGLGAPPPRPAFLFGLSRGAL